MEELCIMDAKRDRKEHQNASKFWNTGVRENFLEGTNRLCYEGLTEFSRATLQRNSKTVCSGHPSTSDWLKCQV